MEIDFRAVSRKFFIDLVTNKLISLGFSNYVDNCINNGKCQVCKESPFCLLYLSVMEEVNRIYIEETYNDDYDFNKWFDCTIELFKMGYVIEPSKIKINVIESSRKEYNPKEFII